MKHLLFLFIMICSTIIKAQEPKLMIPLGHTSSVNTAEFSSDNKKIVTASDDNTIKVWGAHSGNLLLDLIGHTDKVISACFSPDDSKVLSNSWDGTARIWDALTGLELFKLVPSVNRHTWVVKSAHFSPPTVNDPKGGKYVLTCSIDCTVSLWNANTGKLIRKFKGLENGKVKYYHHTAISANFSPDGSKIVAVAHASFGIVWDVHSGNKLFEVGTPEYLPFVNSEDCISKFSPNGSIIASSFRSSSIEIKSTQNGTLLNELSLTADTGGFNIIRSFNFSPDGTKISAVFYKNSASSFIIVWNILENKVIHEFRNLKPRPCSNFSYNGKMLIASSGNTARIWNLDNEDEIYQLVGHSSNINCAKFSPDGTMIVTASADKMVKIWDSKSGKLLFNLAGLSTGKEIKFANFISNEKTIITYTLDDNVRIQDFVSGEVINEFVGVKSIHSSSNGTKLLATSSDSNAFIWDNFGNEITLIEQEGVVIFADFSVDGSKLITNSNDGNVFIWNTKTGLKICQIEGNHSQITSCRFSLDLKNITIAARQSGYPKTFDANTGKLLSQYPPILQTAKFSTDGQYFLAHRTELWDTKSIEKKFDLKEKSVIHSNFSPDGSKILTVNSFDIRIWNTENGRKLITLEGDNKYITIAKFTPDGKKILTVSEDNTAKIWDAITGQMIANLVHSTNINSINISNDGSKIITVSQDKKMNFWDAYDGSLLYTLISVGSDYLVYDDKGRYDGTENARKLLYFTCDTEIIGLDQVKDQMWVPNLAERILAGETITSKTLAQLEICGLSPKIEEETLDENEYHFNITPQRGGLGETVVYVNGIEVKRVKPSELKSNGANYELVLSKVELAPFFTVGSSNPVTVKSFTRENTVASRGAVITDVNSVSQTIHPNLFAVMVGVSDYKGDDLDLKFAAKDATNISSTLNLSAKKLLNTDNKEHVFIYRLTTEANSDRFPDKNTIKMVFEEIGKKATSSDILLIFFAGHGVMDSETKQFYFLTADASGFNSLKDVGISTAELSEWMKPQNIKAQKRILILDACNSGQAINDFVKIGDENQNFIAARNDDKSQQIKAIDKLNEKSGFFILAAAASNQSAYEMGRYSQGLLTYSLLKAIKQNPAILEEGNLLNVSSWFNEAEKTVSELSIENGARQDPQIVSNTNFNVGVVDNEVISKIILPTEKHLFSACNFQNADENILDDNLDFGKLVNQQLRDISSRGSDSKLLFTPSTNSPDAYKLIGRYTITGNSIKVSVNVKQGKLTKTKFEISGSINDLSNLANKVATKAAETVQ